MQNFKDGVVPVSSNKLSALIAYGVNSLGNIYQGEELHNIVWWIAEHYTNIHRIDGISNPAILVNQSNVIHFCNAVEKLKTGMPVQYVIGETDFLGFKIKVNPAVLIPRPETEELADLIIKENKHIQHLTVLDIGTGSGCIPIALGGSLKDAKITAVDISKEALNVAKHNATLNHISGIEWLELDILHSDYFINKQFDIIVSNPPYIAMNEKHTMQENVVNFEPHAALFVNDFDPLLFYKRIAVLVETSLHPNGKMYVEINERFPKETVELFTSQAKNQVVLLHDMYGKPRFIKLIKI